MVCPQLYPESLWFNMCNSLHKWVRYSLHIKRWCPSMLLAFLLSVLAFDCEPLGYILSQCPFCTLAMQKHIYCAVTLPKKCLEVWEGWVHRYWSLFVLHYKCSCAGLTC